MSSEGKWMDKPNTYTIILDDNEIIEKIEAYTLIGSFFLNPVSANVQAVHHFAFGRASIGDHCSMIVAAIQTAKMFMEEKNVPEEVISMMLMKAIQEGLV